MKTLLYDAKLEAMAIGTLIAHPEFLLVENNLRPTFFFEKENQCLIWAIQTLAMKGVDVIDALNLETVLSGNAAVRRVMESKNLRTTFFMDALFLSVKIKNTNVDGSLIILPDPDRRRNVFLFVYRMIP